MGKLKNKEILHKIMVGIGFVLLFVFFCLVNENSFLYGWNYQYDEGIYWNVSKTMLQGNVLYKDIIDFKGPIFFFIYEILYMISFPHTQSGVFIYDFICVFTTFIFVYKTNKIFQPTKEALIGTLMASFLFVIYYDYIGNPEEFIMMAYSIIVYWILSKKYQKDNLAYIYVISILSGMIFMIKYNLIIFPLAAFFLYLKNKIIKEEKWSLMLHCMVGFSIPSIITIIYFIKNNALVEFWNVYCMGAFKYGDKSIVAIDGYIVIIPLVVLYWIALRKFFKKENLTQEYICLFVGLVLVVICQFVMSGNFFHYYYFVLFPFIIFPHIDLKNTTKKCIIYIMLALVLVLDLMLASVKNQEAFNQPYEDNPSNTFKQYLNEDDVGFAFCTSPAYLNELPIYDKYFFFLNFTYDAYQDMYDEVYVKIEDKYYDYIIVKKVDGSYYMDSFLSLSMNGKMFAVNAMKSILSNYTPTCSHIDNNGDEVWLMLPKE